MKRVAAPVCMLALALALASTGVFSQHLPLKLVADIELPGATNRFDYQTIDPATHRLFIAHLGASTVVVFDTISNKIVREIANIREVHGVLAVPDTGNVYASATGTDEIVVIDVRTLKEVARIPGGSYPDGMAYAPDVKKLYVSDETGGTETVIDTSTDRRVKTLPMQGEVGNSYYDAATKHVFANVQTRNELVEIDPQTDTVVGRYPLAGSKHNHGLLIDPAARVAYVACEGNGKLLVVDLGSKRVLATHDVGAGPDVLAYDPTLGLLYVASESGVVSVFRHSGTALDKVGEALLAKHAHSVAVDSDTHRVYFPIENVAGRPVLRIMEPYARAEPPRPAR